MLWPFKFGAQHVNLGDLTCSDKEEIGLDFISHAERKNAEAPIIIVTTIHQKNKKLQQHSSIYVLSSELDD